MARDQLEFIELENLLLDANNPRFGGQSTGIDQVDILDRIVDQFGIADLLSSIAVNGFIPAEPLVCIPSKPNKYKVVEGNRRLASCLILSNDPRARNHAEKSKKYRDVWRANGSKKVDPVPCQVFDPEVDKEELLSFLGVRHISASQPWDSYAKAAWIAEISESTNLSFQDIASMVGDKSNTVSRLLLGYYVTTQLISAGAYDPATSQKSGRGSQVNFPFSWIYTILGYSSVKAYLGLEDGAPRQNPLNKQSVARGGRLFKMMFGTPEHSPVISDSRELGSLASALGEPAQLVLLEDGVALETVLEEAREVDTRILTALRRASEALSKSLTIASGAANVPDNIGTLIEEADRAQKLARSVSRELRSIGLDDDQD